MKQNKSCVFLILFSIVTGLLSAQANADLVTASKSSLLIELAKQTQQDNPLINENSVTRLLYDVKITVGKHRATTTYTEIWYYPNRGSIQDYGYETIYYNGHTDLITSLQAVTIQANGKALWFDNKNAKELDDDSFNVFTEGKELIVNYVGLEKGSTTAIEYEIETDLRKKESFWSRIFHVSNTRAQNHIRIEVAGIEGKNIFHASDSEHISCEQKDNTILCEGRRIPSISKDDSMFFRDQSQQIGFSEINDWRLAKIAVLDGFSAARRDNQDVMSYVNKLVNSEMTPEQKITKVHEFVVRDVRYVSMSEAGNAIRPHSIAQTLENRYGDCKDKTALLLEMLDQIGVDAYPVLVSTNRLNQNKLLIPSIGYFNHVVLCFELNGQKHCIDATDSTSDWRYTSNWINGNVSLPLVEIPEQNQGPQTLPLPKFPWRIENTIDIEITDAGGQNEQQRIAFYDAYASRYRSTLETQSAQERVEWALSLYESEISESVVPSVEITGIDTLAEPIRLTTNAEYEAYLSIDEDETFLEYDPWILYELASIDLENEVYVTHFYGSKVTSIINVNVPAIWDLQSYPADLNLVTNYGRMRRKVSRLETGKFTVETDFEVPSVNLPADEVEAFNKAMEVLKAQSDIQFSGKLAK